MLARFGSGGEKGGGSGSSNSSSRNNRSSSTATSASFSRPGHPLSSLINSSSGGGNGTTGGSASPRVDPLSSSLGSSSNSGSGGGASTRGGNSGSLSAGALPSNASSSRSGSGRSAMRYSSDDYYSESGSGGNHTTHVGTNSDRGSDRGSDRRFRSYDEYSQGSAASSSHEDERYDHHDQPAAGVHGSSSNHYGTSRHSNAALFERLSANASDSPPAAASSVTATSAVPPLPDHSAGGLSLSSGSANVSSLRKRSEKSTGTYRMNDVFHGLVLQVMCPMDHLFCIQGCSQLHRFLRYDANG